MTTKPILFSGPMVRALLDGRKTQTRRVLSPQPQALEGLASEQIEDHELRGWRCEQVGDQLLVAKAVHFGYDDLLWVREAWQTSPTYDDLKPSEMGGDESIRFEADGQWESWGRGGTGCVEGGRKRPGIFMPRWASRLTLRVTDVQVQRVQDISEDDARAEGLLIGETDFGDLTYSGTYWDYPIPAEHLHHWPQDAFRALWDSINFARGFGWADNPWVAAYTFEVIRGNVDEVT